MLRLQIQKIIESASTSEEAAYLICYWLTTQTEIDATRQFQDDTLMTILLADSSDDMAQLIASYGNP